MLAERKSPDSNVVWVGRTAGQATDIDGVPFLGNVEGFASVMIVRASVNQTNEYDLVGVICEA